MDKKSLRIDLVSDVVCPWCVIGYKRLQKSLENFSDRIEVDLHWHPFELNPQMPEDGQNLREHISEKYGTDPNESGAARAKLAQVGADVGFEFNYYDDMRIMNTFKAHQLLHWARLQGKETELKLAFFKAYFTDQKDVSDEEALLEVVDQLGLDKTAAQQVLEEKTYAEKVREEQYEWLNKGIHAVPAFVLNNQYLISGAQEPEFISGQIERLLESA